ncbi:beta-ketoacyl synthase N-terminal-like domain-containing protein [Actinomadura roseirufa]|uniref:beta-ketoacyl synthase N-terminal-like domain-containing protein n=1 Tax=Actinomadura roseirufa TaxID=2094049 RepID=UPI0010412A4E|nr:beta-ketoacyl synthase N-terminal-like domain-containing protein [Actinomadura roseirufa]
MNAWSEADGLRVAGDGLARTADLGSAGRTRASFYADPVAWLVVDALELALERAGPHAREALARTGVLAVSEYATRHTMGSIGRQAARGRVSPLRFAGASPGSLAGLACVVLGFRGPTLLLGMPPATARAAALAIVSHWTATGQCRYVAVAEHSVTGAVHTVHGRIVERDDAPVPPKEGL